MAYNIFKLNRIGIPPLLEGIETRDQWEEKRSNIWKTWFDYIGGIPDKVPLRYDVLAETEEERHIIRHLVYDTFDGDRVPALLLIPKEALSGASGRNARRFPAVMALHPTIDTGKADTALRSGRENRRYGFELAERGYVVLAPDALTAGERIYPGLQAFRSAPFYEKYPQWSTMGKNLIDHIQGIDLLCSLDFVDESRIGAIGHSFGGYNAYFLGGADRRIRAVVSSCGFGTLSGGDYPTHWGVRDWYTHLPRISEDLSKGQIPFEFHEIAALVAPTPFFNYSGQSCYCFPNWETIGTCMKELYELYKFLGAGDRFLSVIGAKEHDFPEEIRELAYRFLDKWLLTPE